MRQSCRVLCYAVDDGVSQYLAFAVTSAEGEPALNLDALCGATLLPVATLGVGVALDLHNLRFHAAVLHQRVENAVRSIEIGDADGADFAALHNFLQ